MTGPDEYTTLVNDNTFTNLMAQHNLRFAVETVRAVHATDPRRYALLQEKTGLLAIEVDQWSHAAENMYVPYDETLGINPQDADMAMCLLPDDLLGNAAEGVHVAAAGGVWMALVYGFGGMTQRDGHLRFEPRLPSEWSRLAIRVQVQESRLLVEITHEAVSYRLELGDDHTISQDGRPLTLSRGQPTTVPVRSAGPYRKASGDAGAEGQSSNPRRHVSGLRG